MALGSLFNPTFQQFWPAAAIIATRMATGLLVGLVIVELLGLRGIDRSVLLILASTPVGFNTITFATLENLDKPFAASTVSLLLIISLILIPMILILTGT